MDVKSMSMSDLRMALGRALTEREALVAHMLVMEIVTRPRHPTGRYGEVKGCPFNDELKVKAGPVVLDAHRAVVVPCRDLGVEAGDRVRVTREPGRIILTAAKKDGAL